MPAIVPGCIGLFDAMGHGNLGDAAIQDAVIANIKKRLPHAQIIGFSFVPDDTMARHSIPCYPITRHSRPSGHVDSRGSITSTLKSAFKLVPVLRALARPVAEALRESIFLVRSFKVLRDLDLLIISGGGQLCELWGGPWSHPYNLFKFSVLARLAGTRLYILNVGAEPLEHRLSRFFAKSTVRLADYVSFRDIDSQNLVRSWGVRAETYVNPDPAYALDVRGYLNGSSGASLVPTVGVNPIGFCDPRIWPRKDPLVYEAYLGKLTEFSLWLLEQGYALRLFPTSIDVDKYAIADLIHRLRQRSASDASMTRVSDCQCEDVKGLLWDMSRCDFVLTTKYHGVISSHLLRKPVIALSYQRKIEVAMQAAGQGHLCANIEHFSTEWLVATFRSLVNDCEALRSQETSAVAANSNTLHKQFDELFPPSAIVPKPAGRELVA